MHIMGSWLTVLWLTVSGDEIVFDFMKTTSLFSMLCHMVSLISFCKARTSNMISQTPHTKHNIHKIDQYSWKLKVNVLVTHDNFRNLWFQTISNTLLLTQMFIFCDFWQFYFRRNIQNICFLIIFVVSIYVALFSHLHNFLFFIWSSFQISLLHSHPTIIIYKHLSLSSREKYVDYGLRQHFYYHAVQLQLISLFFYQHPKQNIWF